MGVNLNPDYIQHIFGTWKPQGFHFLFYRPRIKKIVSKVIKLREKKNLRPKKRKPCGSVPGTLATRKLSAQNRPTASPAAKRNRGGSYNELIIRQLAARIIWPTGT